jgi:hypothetical protein
VIEDDETEAIFRLELVHESEDALLRGFKLGHLVRLS